MRAFEGFVVAGLIAAVALGGVLAWQVSRLNHVPLGEPDALRLSRLKIKALAEIARIDSLDSPITVVGGSMTFHAPKKSKWSGTSPTFSVKNTDITQIELEDTLPEISWPLDGSTKFTINLVAVARLGDPSGTKRGIQLIGDPAGGGTVTITPFSLKSDGTTDTGDLAKLGFYTKATSDHPSRGEGKRYLDGTMPSCVPDLCEHLDRVEVIVGSSSVVASCNGGECRVHIGKRTP